MEQKHPYFDVHTFDRSYTSVRRSFKLKPNEKALIYHIIGWQESVDENGKLRNLECFESNSTLSEELGIPFDTFETLIRNMKKKYTFFSAESLPGKGKSRNGGNYNRTIKRINMKLLVQFLSAEKTEREHQQEQVNTKPAIEKEILEKPVIAPEVEPIKTLNRDEAYVKLNAWVKWREEEERMTKGKEVESIRSNILITLNEFVITRGWTQQLQPFIDDYINENLLIKTPTKGRRAETEEEYYSRKERERQPKREEQEEYVGVDLWSGLGNF